MDLLWLLTGASLFSAIVFVILWIQNQKKYYATLQELQDTTERLSQEHTEEAKHHQQMLTDQKAEHVRTITKLKWEHDEEVKKLQQINTAYAPLINSDKEIEIRHDEINRLKDKLLQLNEKYQIARRVYVVKRICTSWLDLLERVLLVQVRVFCLIDFVVFRGECLRRSIQKGLD